MDVRVINPFIDAVCGGVETMTGLEVERGKPFVKGDFQAFADITGIIGLAGQVRGAVTLSFPSGLAKRLFETMIGETVEPGNPGIADAVGELANITAGGAKQKLDGMGYDFTISTPSFMRAAKLVSALPMSICPQTMLCCRPSSEVDFVRPVIACLEAV